MHILTRSELELLDMHLLSLVRYRSLATLSGPIFGQHVGMESVGAAHQTDGDGMEREERERERERERGGGGRSSPCKMGK